jgi:hypothetical protein
MAILLMASLAACGGSDSPDPGSAEAKADPVACTNLPTAFKAANVVLSSATEVAEAMSNGVTTPAYCDVRGAINGNIKSATFLPANWNGRLQMASLARGQGCLGSRRALGRRADERCSQPLGTGGVQASTRLPLQTTCSRSAFIVERQLKVKADAEPF